MPRPVSDNGIVYKPYTLEDYRELPQVAPHFGGLGPDFENPEYKKKVSDWRLFDPLTNAFLDGVLLCTEGPSGPYAQVRPRHSAAERAANSQGAVKEHSTFSCKVR